MIALMPCPAPDRTLSRKLCSDDGGELLLSHYPAGGEQPRHAHDHAQISFLLAGRIQESIGRQVFEPVAGACVKAAGTDHSDRWGGDGAMMLSLRLPAVDEEGVLAADRWGPADLPRVALIVRAALDGAAPAETGLLAADLLACIGRWEPPTSPPPTWLERVREAASELQDFSLARAADEAGVHRVHLSRAFARHYGLPLSLYRQHIRNARALAGTLRRRDEPLAAIAYAAGFADQSHMSRALRLATGAAPAGLRRLFSPAPARSGRRP
jgi:AraC family transcriptional regulator